MVLDNASGEVLAWVGSSGELSGAAAGRRRARAAPAGLDVEAVRLRARLRAAPDHAGDADRRFAGAARHRHRASTCRRTTTTHSRVRQRAHGARREPERAGRARRRDARQRRAARSAATRSASRCPKRRLLRRLARARQRRRHAARADERLPHARQRRPPGAGALARAQAERRRSAWPIRPRASWSPTSSPTTTPRPHLRLESALATRGFAAVKTGTSKDMRDNWCVGFTDRYTVGVWVGNASGEAMHDVSGVSGAAPVWQAIAAYLHADAASKAPALPAGVVAAAIAFDSKREPERDEFFVAGTEPPAAARHRRGARGAERYGITSPRDGSIFAIDPDIPPAAQRITFEGERGVWRLDGRVLGDGERLRWAPWPGTASAGARRRVGRDAAERRFEVRGAGVKASRARALVRAPGQRREQPLHRGVDHQPAQAVEQRADQRARRSRRRGIRRAPTPRNRTSAR